MTPQDPSRSRPGTSVSPAGWVEDGIGDFGSGVSGLLPDQFDHYARVLHPAGTDAAPSGVPWSKVADWAGRTMHPLAQFEAIASPRAGAGRGLRPWSRPPSPGEPPADLLRALCEVLTRSTDSSEQCWFCLWEGYGWIDGSPSAFSLMPSAHQSAASSDMHAPSPPAATSRQRVRLPQREYLLFEGPLKSATAMGWRPGELLAREYPEAGFDSDQFDPQPPNLFWPDDHAWCVANEIDLDSIYIAGSIDLIADILDDPRLEAWPANRNDRVDVGADQINR